MLHACIARFGGYGDNLICSSVLPGLKARYGHVEVITRKPAGVVFENNPYIDKLTYWPEKDGPEGGEFWRRVLQNRQSEYDFFVHLSSTCEGRLAFLEAQPEFWWPEKMRRQMAAHSYLGFVHDICDLPHDFAPGFFPTDEERAKAASTLDGLRARRRGPFVGWQLSGSRIDKRYPGTVPVIIRLLEMGCNVCMFGGSRIEYEMAREIEKQVREQVRSIDGLYLMMTTEPTRENMLVCDWPLRRSLTTLQMCDVVVGPDTGPMWSVAMCDMPKIMLLSHASAFNITHGWSNTVTLHADPAQVSCWPCHKLNDSFFTCRKHPDLEAAACISDISIASVVNAVRDALTPWRPLCQISPPTPPSPKPSQRRLKPARFKAPLRI